MIFARCYSAAMRKTGKDRIASRTEEQLEEGRRLKQLFDERWTGTQQQFCQWHLNGKYSGGLGQFFSGHTLISTEVARAAIDALPCTPDEIGPRIAREFTKYGKIWVKTARTSSSGEPAQVHNPPVHRWGETRMSDDATWQWEPADGKPPSGRYAIQIFSDALHPFVTSGHHVVLDSSVKYHAGSRVLIVLSAGLALIRELVTERDGNIAVRGIIDGKRQTWPSAEVRFMHTIVSVEHVGMVEWEP